MFDPAARYPAATLLAVLLLALGGCDGENTSGGNASSVGCVSSSECHGTATCVGGVCQPEGGGAIIGDAGTSAADTSALTDTGTDAGTATDTGSDAGNDTHGSTDPDTEAETAVSTDTATDTQVSADTASDTADAGPPGKPCDKFTSCDDGDQCTTDACVAGKCKHTAKPGCCTEDGDCDDSLPCTEDTCLTNSTCKFAHDPTWCFIDGKCVVANTKGAKACTTCAPLLNSKAWTVQDGLVCDDGDPCTAQDTCNLAGVCKGKAVPCGKPDLVSDAFTTALSSFKPGGNAAAVAVVKNSGKLDAGPFKLEFRLSKDKTVDGTDTLLLSQLVTGCKVGATAVKPVTLSLPANAAQGPWFLGLVIDAGNAVAESDEGNNTATTAITLTK